MFNRFGFSWGARGQRRILELSVCRQAYLMLNSVLDYSGFQEIISSCILSR